MDPLNTAPNVLSIVSLGMALAFVLSDRRSVTSRMLAGALASIAASIFINTNWIAPVPPAELGRWAALGAVTDAAAMIFSAQWLLQVRRTIPAGDLDTRVGDWLVRIAQLLSLLYLAIGLVAYQSRAEHFLGGLAGGWVFPSPEFLFFAGPLILAMIAGGATGVLTNVIFDSGLRAPASPGSIFAVLIQTEPGSYVGVILSEILSASVTFVVAMLILLASRKRDLANEDEAFSAAIAQTEANKGKKSEVLSGLTAKNGGVHNVVFACDAGMGSSAMGASVLRQKLKKAGVTDVTVTNKAIANLDGTEDLIITQAELTDRAKHVNPSAVHVSVDNFMNSPKYDEVAEMLSNKPVSS